MLATSTDRCDKSLISSSFERLYESSKTCGSGEQILLRRSLSSWAFASLRKCSIKGLKSSYESVSLICLAGSVLAPLTGFMSMMLAQPRIGSSFRKWRTTLISCV